MSSIAASGSGGPLPGDREALLARVGAERRQVFVLVRRLVDDLDEAAPWEALYFPPDGTEAFLAMLGRLVGLVDGIPARVRAAIDELQQLALDDETRGTLEEAEFYFGGIHGMCAHDLGRLRALLAGHAESAAEGPIAAARNYLCEVAADLKGKYAGALMGATASVVGEGLWPGVAVEPVLFPEKAEERPRNEALVRALQRTLAAIRELPEQVPFTHLLERWRAGARVDPYALADLATFRGVLGQLLKRGMRRALYSGDYHQIQWRERALSERIADLEAAHLRTWAEIPPSAEVAAATHRELVRLTLEVAALLDLDLLERLAGAAAIGRLRAAVMGEADARLPLDPELDTLVPLLATEDLETFLDLLLGSVLKRATFAPVRAAAEADDGGGAAESPASEASAARGAGAAPDAKRPGPALPPAPLPAPLRPGAGAPAGSEVAEILAPYPAPPAEPGPPGAEPAAPPLPRLVPQGAAAAAAGSAASSPQEVLAQLDATLGSLLAHDNPDRSALRMLRRLLERHSRIPPSMIHAAHPFLFSVLNELVPHLEAAAALGLVPPAARDRLVECCTALTDRWLTPEQMDREVPANFTRLERLLEGLAATTAAQLRAR